MPDLTSRQSADWRSAAQAAASNKPSSAGLVSPFMASRIPAVFTHRMQLQADFFAALYEDFAVNGADAIERCRKKQPAMYLKIVATLMPKQTETRAPLEELTDDDLLNAVAILRERIEAGAFAPGVGNETSTVATQARLVRAVSEADGVPCSGTE